MIPGDNYTLAVVPGEEQQELEWFRPRDYSSKEKIFEVRGMSRSTCCWGEGLKNATLHDVFYFTIS